VQNISLNGSEYRGNITGMEIERQDTAHYKKKPTFL
jgi:hypothetical protein